MKTKEMMTRAKEGKLFKRKSDGLLLEISPNGYLFWNSGATYLNINDEWEEVKEPVDFITAFKAFREGKAISVEDGELSGGRFIYYPRTNERYVAFSEEDIANGKWYIED